MEAGHYLGVPSDVGILGQVRSSGARCTDRGAAAAVAGRFGRPDRKDDRRQEHQRQQAIAASALGLWPRVVVFIFVPLSSLPAKNVMHPA